MYLTEKQKLQLVLVLKERAKEDSECASLLQEILDQQNNAIKTPSQGWNMSPPLTNPSNFKETIWSSVNTSV